MKLTHTITLTELIWTIVSLVGSVYAAKITYSSYQAILLVRKLKINSVRGYAALLTFRTYGAFLFTQCMFVAAGVAAMSFPSPLQHGNIPALQYIDSAVFVIIVLFLSFALRTINKMREELLRNILDRPKEDQ